jgi:hypothetical protein
MIKGKLSRRRFLERVGGAAVLSPFVPLLESEVEAAGPRKRLVIYSTPNGVVNGSGVGADGFRESMWGATGSGTNFTLSPALAPLAEFKSDLIILNAVSLPAEVITSGGGGGHTGCPPVLLTAVPSRNFGGGKRGLRATGISVDQHIAKTIGKGLRFESLQLSVGPYEHLDHGVLSYAGSNQPLPPEPDPYAIYERIFKGVTGTAGAGAARAADALKDEKSVIDFVVRDLGRVSRRLGAIERQRMEKHLEAIRQVETTLSVPQVSGDCAVPKRGNRLDHKAYANLPTVATAQIGSLLGAFTCDLTRVSTLQWGHSGWDAGFSVPAMNLSFRSHHALNHAGGNANSAANDAMLAKWVAYAASRLAELARELKARPEGDGTMLDYTIIAWVSEFGNGQHHRYHPIPMLFLGGKKLWKTGRYIKFPSRTNHSNALVSLCRAMGLADQTFGVPGLCKGPIAQLFS